MFFTKWLALSWLTSFYESFFKPIPQPHGSIDFSWYHGLHREPCPFPVTPRKRCNVLGNVLTYVKCSTPTGGHVDAQKKLCLEHACGAAVARMIANLPPPWEDQVAAVRRRLGKDVFEILTERFAKNNPNEPFDPKKFMEFVHEVHGMIAGMTTTSIDMPESVFDKFREAMTR